MLHAHECCDGELPCVTVSDYALERAAVVLQCLNRQTVRPKNCVAILAHTLLGDDDGDMVDAILRGALRAGMKGQGNHSELQVSNETGQNGSRVVLTRTI